MNALMCFKALSDSTRIRIYNVLLRWELSVNELVGLMDMGQSRISRHLKILTDAGLLTCRRNGVWAFYSAVREGWATSFSEAVSSLFRDDALLQDDLRRAALTVDERSARTRQFFNAIAPRWDVLKSDIMGAFDINAAILEQGEDVDKAADLGCGTGELLVSLAGRARRVIGVDSSPMMLEEARKRFSGQGIAADLRLGELEHLPLKDDEVDLAVISLALHHLSEPVLALCEARRILRDGGRLIVAEFDRHDNEMLRHTYGDRWLGFPREDMDRWIREAGFTMVHLASHALGRSLVINIFTCTTS
ncbi:metalloregulator ArsR/SmtB family transcription factor [Desulfatiferula olefinivorans]